MDLDEILKIAFVGLLLLVPTTCAVLTCVRLLRNRPRWPAVACAGALVAGAAASIPLAQSAAANAENEPARWWAVVALVATLCGNAAALLALLAVRRWTREAKLNQTVTGLWVIAVLFIGIAFLAPGRKDKPVVIPIKKRA